MAIHSSQDVFISWQDVPEVTEHSSGALHSQKTQNKGQKRVMASRNIKVWWNSETNLVRRPFAELIQIYSDKIVMSLKLNFLVVYLVHVV